MGGGWGGWGGGGSGGHPIHPLDPRMIRTMLFSDFSHLLKYCFPIFKNNANHKNCMNYSPVYIDQLLSGTDGGGGVWYSLFIKN